MNSKHETSLYATQKLLFSIYFTFRLLLRCCHCTNITIPHNLKYRARQQYNLSHYKMNDYIKMVDSTVTVNEYELQI
jgi:hypothetical protein